MDLYHEIGITEYFTENEPAHPDDFMKKCKDFIVIENYDYSIDYKGKKHLYLLVKNGISTFKAFRKLYRKHKVKITGYLGFKDKSSLSMQYITLQSQKTPRRIYCIKNGWARNIGNIRNKLYPGKYDSNSFVITIPFSDQVLEVINELKQLKYMPNFYGHQRFGYQQPLNHKKALILLRQLENNMDLSNTSLQIVYQSLQSYIFNYCLNTLIKKYSLKNLLFKAGVLVGPGIFNWKPPKWVSKQHYLCARNLLYSMDITEKDLMSISKYIRVAYRPLIVKEVIEKVVTEKEKIIFKLKLPPSSYASIILREIFKENNSWINVECNGKIKCPYNHDPLDS